jgi:type I restriction enzyme S subunit
VAVTAKGAVRRIGEICEIVNGGTPKTGVGEYWGGTHQWITPAEMGNRSTPYVANTQRTLTDLGLKNSSARLLPPHSVILSSRAPIGHLMINTKPMATNQGCKGLVPGKTIDYQYLFHYLTSIVGLLNELGTGATFKELSSRDLKHVEIPLPSIAEQHRVVARLAEAFDGISKARADTDLNLRNARALFESQLEAIFRRRGEGFIERRLGDVCSITSRLVDPRLGAYVSLTHVGAGNIESETGRLRELKTAREEGLISGKFLFEESMVLYSKIRPYLRKVARPDFKGLCSADIYPLSPAAGQVTRDYMFYLLLSRGFTEYAMQGSARAGMPKVNREHLFGYHVWLPPLEQQIKDAAMLNSLADDTARIASVFQQKLVALGELKRSILHHAFTGAV